MKGIFHMDHGILRPFDETGRKIMGRLKTGDKVIVETKRQRNIRHHNLYWATIGFFAEHSDRTPRQVHALFRDLTGRYDRILKRDGSEIRDYHSTAWGNMDEDEFSAYHRELIDALWKEVMPGVPEGVMRKELEAFLR